MALLSKWHVHAEDYANQANHNENLSIKCIWDENIERGKEWAAKWEVPFEEDLDKVLLNPDIHAVIVDTPTIMHPEVITKAAQHGKHIFTEKVLALTSEDCKKIFSEVENNNVSFMISLPRLTESYYLYAEKVLQDGYIGKLTTIRCRMAHNGSVSTDQHPDGWLPEHFYDATNTGGGAFIDLGAHPIYLTNRLAGKALSVVAKQHLSEKHNVDDNTVAIVEYENGILGILETGFTSGGSPFQLELYGTDGTLLIEDGSIRLRTSKINNGEWYEPSDLPKNLPSPMEQWVNAILKQEKPTITKEDALNLTIINEAVYLSQREDRKIVIK